MSLLRIVVAHVYIGGAFSNNFNQQAFGDAVNQFNSMHSTLFFCPTFMTCADVKNQDWDFKCLIDWLFDCDVHFILTHMHQGPAGHGGLGQMGWEVEKMYKYLENKLFDHPGFPTGVQLRCPIFTQNKFDYLKPLIGLHTDVSFVNKTLKVHLRKDGNYDNIRSELERFLDMNKGKFGWFVKMPFTTNKDFAKGCNTKEKVFKAIRLAAHRFFPRIRYVMIQAQMNNRREYKIVFIGGKPLWIANICQKATNSKSFSPPGHNVIKKWASHALQALQHSCPHAICDGLVRVDVFQRNGGGLVVNEFESLEADVPHSSHDDQAQRKGLATLKDYFVLKIQQALDL